MPGNAEMTDNAQLDERRKLVSDFRQHVGMDLKKFAKRAKISYAMLSQFENGNRNLSEKAWKRVHREILKIYHKPPAPVKATPLAARKAREIVGNFDSSVGYPALVRAFDEKTRQESRDNQALAEDLRNHLKVGHAQVVTWLEAEIALEIATQRAMDAAEIVRSGYGPEEMLGAIRESDGSVTLTTTGAKPYEFHEATALMACEQGKGGKIVPWQRKKLSKPEPSGRFEVRLANNPKEEAELLAAGWQEVKSE